MPVDLGQTYRYRQTVTDSSSVPQDAGTVTAVITLPDGTTSGTLTLTHAGTGLYDLSYLTVQAGLHVLTTTATGGILGSEVDVWQDVFTVEESGVPFISVDEASQHLRAAGIITSSADREQLRWYCLVASSAVEGDLGIRIAPRTVTETHNGGQLGILLRTLPVLSIVSVTHFGQVLPVGSWVLDQGAGLLFRGTTLVPIKWLNGVQNTVIVLRAGYMVPPPVARKVALNTVERMWQASQQAPHEALDANGAVFAAVSTLTEVERSAYQVLQAPGIA